MKLLLVRKSFQNFEYLMLWYDYLLLVLGIAKCPSEIGLLAQQLILGYKNKFISHLN